jgi:hypothetical protein
MSARDRIGLTFAAGVILGLDTLASEWSGWPTAGLHHAVAMPLTILAVATFFLVPLVVARPWVLGAMAGPFLALVIMQAAGVAVTLDDTTGPALNYRTTFQLIALCVAMLAVVGLRGAFDAVQDRRTSSGRGRLLLRRNV